MASWFRSWHGAPTDNKWLVIARRANVAPGVVSAVAWALMDHASQADDRGSVAGFDVETYCAFSGFPEQDVNAILDALQFKNVIGIDDRLTAWDKRQPKREDDSTDRVRDWRAKQRNDVTPSLQQDVTHGNAVKRSVTHGNNTDTDTDTDTEKILTAQAQPRVPKPKPEPKPEREPSETWIIAEALADVCKMDLTANKGRLLKEAATLLKANPHPTPELLRQHYNGGGWWWANDWRGQRREFPQPATIRETWGKWSIEAPEVKPFAVEEWR